MDDVIADCQESLGRLMEKSETLVRDVTGETGAAAPAAAHVPSAASEVAWVDFDDSRDAKRRKTTTDDLLMAIARSRHLLTSSSGPEVRNGLDVVETHDDAVENVFAHPRFKEASTRLLLQRVTLHRANAVARLRQAIECVERHADKRPTALSGDFARECKTVLSRLEETDPVTLLSTNEIFEINERMKKLFEKLSCHFLDAGGPPP